MLKYISTDPPEDGGVVRQYWHSSRRGVVRVSLCWLTGDENVIGIGTLISQYSEAAIARKARSRPADIAVMMATIKARVASRELISDS